MAHIILLTAPWSHIARLNCIQKRARVMEQWAAFVTTSAPAGAGNVAPTREVVATDG